MKIQYDLPQEMLNRMLGDWEPIYPKYSTALWEKGATNLEEAQAHMIDQLIERLGIEDGDHVLDFGCGWGCVPNYILSKFPNVRVTGLNLSHQQCDYMRNKMRDPVSSLSSGRFTLIEGDLNEMEFSTKFLITQLAPRTATRAPKAMRQYHSDHGTQRHSVPEGAFLPRVPAALWNGGPV